MEIKATHCPNCGARLNIDLGDATITCPYCDSSFLVSSILDDSFADQVSISQEVESYLERAEILRSDGSFRQAERIYNLAIDKAPKCARAYYGIFLCRYKSKAKEPVNFDYKVYEDSHLKQAAKLSHKYATILENNKIYCQNEITKINEQLSYISKTIKNINGYVGKANVYKVLVTVIAFIFLTFITGIFGSENGDDYWLGFAIIAFIGAAVFAYQYINSDNNKKFNEEISIIDPRFRVYRKANSTNRKLFLKNVRFYSDELESIKSRLQ